MTALRHTLGSLDCCLSVFLSLWESFHNKVNDLSLKKYKKQTNKNIGVHIPSSCSAVFTVVASIQLGDQRLTSSLGARSTDIRYTWLETFSATGGRCGVRWGRAFLEVYGPSNPAGWPLNMHINLGSVTYMHLIKFRGRHVRPIVILLSLLQASPVPLQVNSPWHYGKKCRLQIANDGLQIKKKIKIMNKQCLLV